MRDVALFFALFFGVISFGTILAVGLLILGGSDCTGRRN